MCCQTLEVARGQSPRYSDIDLFKDRVKVGIYDEKN